MEKIVSLLQHPGRIWCNQMRRNNDSSSHHGGVLNMSKSCLKKLKMCCWDKSNLQRSLGRAECAEHQRRFRNCLSRWVLERQQCCLRWRKAGFY
jgi:hypothetical protein